MYEDHFLGKPVSYWADLEYAFGHCINDVEIQIMALQLKQKLNRQTLNKAKQELERQVADFKQAQLDRLLKFESEYLALNLRIEELMHRRKQ